MRCATVCTKFRLNPMRAKSWVECRSRVWGKPVNDAMTGWWDLSIPTLFSSTFFPFPISNHRSCHPIISSFTSFRSFVTNAFARYYIFMIIHTNSSSFFKSSFFLTNLINGLNLHRKRWLKFSRSNLLNRAIERRKNGLGRSGRCWRSHTRLRGNGWGKGFWMLSLLLLFRWLELHHLNFLFIITVMILL